MQRLRIKFCRGEEVKFISHLDIVRLWQRALRRAGIALAYSEGFSPHPQISLAAPLPVGVTSEAEFADILCIKQISPHFFTRAVSLKLPGGIEIVQVYPIPPSMPSLQSQMSYTEYKVEVETEIEQKDIESAFRRLLSLDHLPWQHQRDTGPHKYDLRRLIDDLWLIGYHHPCVTIGMRLRCDSTGSGRPEQVTAALGFTEQPRSIHRTRLILKTR
ncbi:MAG TPA: hypothetical protein DIT43_00355 [Dehalococcoidia bacterium]|nr:hypothetical protein [Dehalococcoidia bacterium]